MDEHAAQLLAAVGYIGEALRFLHTSAQVESMLAKKEAIARAIANLGLAVGELSRAYDSQDTPGSQA